MFFRRAALQGCVLFCELLARLGPYPIPKTPHISVDAAPHPLIS